MSNITFETRIQDEPKRGYPNKTMTLKNLKGEFKPHHQKSLILELLEKEKEMTVEQMTKKINSNEELWKRLNSKQAALNCVVYHMKSLEKDGIITVK